MDVERGRWEEWNLQLLNSMYVRRGSKPNVKDNPLRITPGIKVVEINLCFNSPPPTKGNNFATFNIECRGRRGHGKGHLWDDLADALYILWVRGCKIYSTNRILWYTSAFRSWRRSWRTTSPPPRVPPPPRQRANICIYIYIYICYTHICVYVCIYIYIYMQNINNCIPCVYIYIYR